MDPIPPRRDRPNNTQSQHPPYRTKPLLITMVTKVTLLIVAHIAMFMQDKRDVINNIINAGGRYEGWKWYLMDVK